MHVSCVTGGSPYVHCFLHHSTCLSHIFHFSFLFGSVTYIFCREISRVSASEFCVSTHKVRAKEHQFHILFSRRDKTRSATHSMYYCSMFIVITFLFIYSFFLFFSSFGSSVALELSYTCFRWPCSYAFAQIIQSFQYSNEGYRMKDEAKKMKCFSTVFVENTFFITFRHPVFRVTRFPFPCWAGFHLFRRCFVMCFPLVTRIFPTKRVIKTEFGKRNRKCKKEEKKKTR